MKDLKEQAEDLKDWISKNHSELHVVMRKTVSGDTCNMMSGYELAAKYANQVTEGLQKEVEGLHKFIMVSATLKNLKELQEENTKLKEIAKQYGEFLLLCDRDGRPLLLFDDYLWHYHGIKSLLNESK